MKLAPPLPSRSRTQKSSFAGSGMDTIEEVDDDLDPNDPLAKLPKDIRAKLVARRREREAEEDAMYKQLASQVGHHFGDEVELLSKQVKNQLEVINRRYDSRAGMRDAETMCEIDQGSVTFPPLARGGSAGSDASESSPHTVRQSNRNSPLKKSAPVRGGSPLKKSAPLQGGIPTTVKRPTGKRPQPLLVPTQYDEDEHRSPQRRGNSPRKAAAGARTQDPSPKVNAKLKPGGRVAGVSEPNRRLVKSPPKNPPKSPQKSVRNRGGPPNRSVAELREALYELFVTTGGLFAMMDADRNNNITDEEFARGIAMAGLRPVPNNAEMAALFESFDINSDRMLNYDEMVASLEGDTEALDRVQRGIDAKQDARAQRLDKAAERRMALEKGLPVPQANAEAAAARNAQKREPARPNRTVAELRDGLLHLHVTTGGLYAMMDADKDNNIAFEEFERGIAMSGLRPVLNYAEVRMLFQSFDINNDHLLNYDEMVASLEGDSQVGMKAAENIKQAMAAKDDKKAERLDKAAARRAELQKNAKKHPLQKDKSEMRGKRAPQPTRAPAQPNQKVVPAKGVPAARGTGAPKKPPRSGAQATAPIKTVARGIGGLRSIAELREELYEQHVSTGGLYALMDADRDNNISFQEFERGIAMSGIRPVPNRKEMMSLFKSFDLDSDHFLNFDEMMACLEGDTYAGAEAQGRVNQVLAAKEEAKLERVAKRKGGIDNAPPKKPPRDAAGKIIPWKKDETPMRSVDEMRSSLYLHHVTSGGLFSMMDADRDNNVSFSEFEHGIAMSGIRPVPTRKEMIALFESFDLDSDHFLNFDELLASLEGDTYAGAVALERVNKGKVDAAEAKVDRAAARAAGSGAPPVIARKAPQQHLSVEQMNGYAPRPKRSVEEMHRQLSARQTSAAGLFAQMDTDKNNVIGFDEFEQGIAMSGMRPVPDKEEMLELFNSFDVDRSHLINYKEMIAILKESVRHSSAPLVPQAPTRPRDSNSGSSPRIKDQTPKGRVQKDARSAGALRDALLIRHVAMGQLPAEIFSQMDNNSDDRVTFAEFKRGVNLAGIKPGLSNDEMRYLFESFPLNEDSTLSFNEMVATFEKDKKRMAAPKATLYGEAAPSGRW